MHLRREEASAPARGRRWKLPLEDRLLLVAAYRRTNLTLRQLARCSATGRLRPTGSSTPASAWAEEQRPTSFGHGPPPLHVFSCNSELRQRSRAPI